MKCYHCNENEAEHRFYVNYMGQTGEIHLCSSCIRKFQQYAAGILDGLQHGAEAAPAMAFPGMPPMGFAPPKAARPLGEDGFPEDAGDDMRHRRRLNSLREQLRLAVEAENYESAASLRDEILEEEKSVQYYGTK